MTVEEIKIRRLANQYLTAPSDYITVVRGLCGVQAQFMANALHSLKIRCTDYDADTVKDGLVKNWTIRGTVHVFAREDLPLFLHCENGRNYRKNEWSEKSFWNQRERWALTPERQKYLSDIILKALEDGPGTREELKAVCRSCGMTPEEESGMFDSWGGGVRELCERGFMNYVVQEEKAFCLSPPFKPVPEEEAELELAGRYFTNFGPATIHDAMYFFRVSASKVKKWLSQLPVEAAECGGRTYFYIENAKRCDTAVHGCVFLAGFDQLMLGYEKKESLFLRPEHMRNIFNLAGIVMPALLLDGQVTGRWKKKEKKLLIELFSGLSRRDEERIREKAQILWEDVSDVSFAML